MVGEIKDNLKMVSLWEKSSHYLFHSQETDGAFPSLGCFNLCVVSLEGLPSWHSFRDEEQMKYLMQIEDIECTNSLSYGGDRNN